MYRFLVFAWQQYYPTGPGDFQRAFTTLEEAEDYAEALRSGGSPDFIFTPQDGDEARYGEYDWTKVVEFDPETGAWS